MKVWVAQWSALQIGKCGDPRSVPAGIKTFFGGIKSQKKYIASARYLNNDNNNTHILILLQDER